MRTAEITDNALDWAVSQCEKDVDIFYDEDYNSMGFLDHDDVFTCYNPSEDWRFGGPIIERENISINTRGFNEDRVASIYSDVTENWEGHVEGSTYLEAAMRCYCASKLGDEIEIPEELL